MTDEANLIDPTMLDESPDSQTKATSAWSRLLAGNRRFAKGEMTHPAQDPATRKSLEHEQHPMAAILSCSDSRVAPELIFDAGLGDIFSVRTAAEMVGDSVMASLELAVTEFHVPLLVILGHTNCMALHAAEHELDDLVAHIPTHVDDSDITAHTLEDLDEVIADSESPLLRWAGMSVWQARMADLHTADDYEQVHVAHMIEYIVTHSEIIREAIANEQLMMVGARYMMDSGLVEVLSF